MTNSFLKEGYEPADTKLVFIVLPASILPAEREERYGDPLDAELRLAGIGYVSGGGSSLEPPDAEGNQAVCLAGIDVDTIDIDRARILLRTRLPALGCPIGTAIQYDNLQDRYDGDWHLDEPRVDYL